jgi:hypothetical protein
LRDRVEEIDIAKAAGTGFFLPPALAVNGQDQGHLILAKEKQKRDSLTTS